MRDASPRPEPLLLGGHATAAERDAYAALEECRLRCERLIAVGAHARRLRCVHRDFGLAGYHISANLHGAARQRSLARARAACGPDVTDPDLALRDLEAAVDRAMVVVEAALAATVLADHAQLTQIRLMDADEALKELAVERSLRLRRKR